MCLHPALKGYRALPCVSLLYPQRIQQPLLMGLPADERYFRVLQVFLLVIQLFILGTSWTWEDRGENYIGRVHYSDMTSPVWCQVKH